MQMNQFIEIKIQFRKLWLLFLCKNFSKNKKKMFRNVEVELVLLLWFVVFYKNNIEEKYANSVEILFYNMLERFFSPIYLNYIMTFSLEFFNN